MFACNLSSRPAKTIEDVIRAVERGDIDQAASYNPQGFISRNGIDSIKESLRQNALWIKHDGGIKSVEVLKEDTVGEVSEVTIKITRGGGDSSVVYYNLIKEKGEWKVDGVASEPTSPPATPNANQSSKSGL
jgi:hypothetical protein